MYRIQLLWSRKQQLEEVGSVSGFRSKNYYNGAWATTYLNVLFKCLSKDEIVLNATDIPTIHILYCTVILKNRNMHGNIRIDFGATTFNFIVHHAVQNHVRGQ